MHPIYMDYAATTPTDKRVIEAMLPYFGEVYGNPSSLHAFGQEAKAAVEDKIVPNPAASYISKTWNERRADLNKIVVDARVKYIMGQIDKAGWQKALADWKAAGGDQVTQEFNELYARDPSKVVIK